MRAWGIDVPGIGPRRTSAADTAARGDWLKGELRNVERRGFCLTCANVETDVLGGGRSVAKNSTS